MSRRTPAPMRAFLVAGVSAAALTAMAQPAFAQAAAEDDSASMVEELVITAEKREQSLQDVPVAVSAFTS
jgi:iron complex outermembrane recepter protein